MQKYQKDKERVTALYGINCRGEIHVVAEVTKTARVRRKLQIRKDLYQKRLQEMQPCPNRNYEGDCRIINKLCPGICPEYQEEGDINE